MARYWRSEHTRHRLQYHLVWIPKYRRRVLTGKIAIRLRQLFYDACRMNGWWIGDLNIQMDHVHVLIQLKPSQGVAEVVQDTNVLNEAAPNTDTAAALSLAEQKSTLTQPTGNYTYSGEMAESSSRNTLGLGQEISKKLGI